MSMTKELWLEKNGFGADGLTWCVFGDDTYAIKEQLKELGCKFSPLLKCPSVFKKSKTKCLLLFFLKIMI